MAQLACKTNFRTAGCASGKVAFTRPAVAPRRTVTTRVAPEVLSSLAAAGDVDAPIGVVLGAAAVVTVVATAIIPLALKPGQEAADQIFVGKQKKTLDKGIVTKKGPAPKKGGKK